MSQRFLDFAVGYVNSPSLGERYCAPMHAFDWGDGQTWSLVWVQWCAIYLPDKDFVSDKRSSADGYAATLVARCRVNSFMHARAPTHVHACTHSPVYISIAQQVAFFKRAVDALDGSPHACVVLKENTLRDDKADPEVDTNDASLTRSVDRLQSLTERLFAVVWCGVVWCSMWRGTARCIAQSCPVQCSTVRHGVRCTRRGVVVCDDVRTCESSE